jgi:excinuclease ABC subunit C
MEGTRLTIPEKLKEKLRDLPDKPGCYLMRDHRGQIIYVGKAASLRKRVQSYFRDASLRSGSPKLRGLVKCIEDIDIMITRNEAEAVLTEGQLIKDYRPRFNVSFRDDKRFLLLRVDLSEPLPMLKLCRIRRDDSARYFGPYASAGAARVAVDFVEKRFGLRKCAPRVPDEQTYKHCMNDVVRFCSAPCMGRISEADYHERVTEACAFLAGERPAILRDLREDMLAESEARNYERASALRDTYLFLHAAVKQRARLAPSRDERRASGREGVEALGDVLGLAKPPRLIEGFDVSNTFGTLSVASMVCSVDGVPKPNRYRRFRIKTVEGSDDPRSIAEAVRRRYARLQAERKPMPDLILIDGGPTQLRAAREALRGLGLENVPSAGLAKRFEEIFWESYTKPILLPRNSKGLHVLQRLRDEAHRFALTYHRHLRSKRIRESALDDIAGVGDARKAAILKHFGSIYKLSRATLDEIMSVPGVGPSLARQVFDHVQHDGSGEDSDSAVASDT